MAPADVTVNETDSAIITCSHPNATSISWRKDGVTIDEVDMMEDFNISSSMEGESWIIIDSASFELHNGSYSCVAELEDGGADVAPFSITVQCECECDLHQCSLAEIRSCQAPGPNVQNGLIEVNSSLSTKGKVAYVSSCLAQQDPQWKAELVS